MLTLANMNMFTNIFQFMSNAYGERSHLSLLDNDDRFSITVRKIKRINGIQQWPVRYLSGMVVGLEMAAGRIVEIRSQGNSDRLFINIENVASRLYLAHSEIYAMAQRENCLQSLKDRAKTVAIALKIQEHCAQIRLTANMPTREEMGELKAVPIRKFTKLISKVQQARAEVTNSCTLNFNEQFYLITPGGQELFWINKLLGKGFSGQVYALSDIKAVQNKEDLVVKIAHHTLQSTEEVRNEYNILRTIHANGPITGIQLPPSQIIMIKSGQTSYYPERCGYLGYKYDEDYFQHIVSLKAEPTFSNLLPDFIQLISGLTYLHSQDILHGDIKIENVFIKHQSPTSKLVHISDLGSSRNAKCVADIKPTTFTPACVAIPDLEQYRELETQPNSREALMTLEKKRDVFAMGTVFYIALERSYPYAYKKNHNPLYHNGQDGNKCENYPDLTAYQKMVNKDVPSEIKELIAQMLDGDYRKRPTASEVFALLSGLHI